MSRFFSARHKNLVPCHVGRRRILDELEGDQQKATYVRLDTNESPFPPSAKAVSRVSKAAIQMQLYPDVHTKLMDELTERIAEIYGLEPNEILIASSTDEIMNLAMIAFCDRYHPVAFPYVAPESYRALAELNGIPFKEVPLNEDFTIEADEYIGLGRTIFLANPNYPTGLALLIDDIDAIVRHNPNNVVIIDESCAGFEFPDLNFIPNLNASPTSAAELVRDPHYENLIVTQSFSVSHSLAGARLGFALGCADLIHDLSVIRDALNPHNVSNLAIAAALGALDDAEYTQGCCRRIAELRNFAADELADLGFIFPSSVSNFLLICHPRIDGRVMYNALKQRGVFVRHFDNNPLLTQYNCITISTLEKMQALVNAAQVILGINSALQDSNHA